VRGELCLIRASANARFTGQQGHVLKDAYARGVPANRVEEARSAVRTNRALLDLRAAAHCEVFDAGHVDTSMSLCGSAKETTLREDVARAAAH
jgi:hypothetical protein